MWNFNCIPLVLLFLSMLQGCQTSSNHPPAFSDTLIGGVRYDRVGEGRGNPVGYGNWLRLQVSQLYDDSLLHHNTEYLHYDSNSITAESFKAFARVRTGDILVFNVAKDSALKRGAPPLAQGKGIWMTHIRVDSIYKDESSMKKDTTKL